MDTFIILVVTLIVIGLVAGIYSSMQSSQNKQALEQELQKLKGFTPSQKLTDTGGHMGIAVDVARNKLCVIWKVNNVFGHKIFECRDLLSVEIFEDGDSITKTVRSSQVAGAIIGGLALGGVGLLIGGLSGKQRTSNKIKSMDLRIMVNDPSSPIYDINLLNIESSKDGILYRSAISSARHWDGVLKVLIRRADEMEQQSRHLSAPRANLSSPLSLELQELADLRDARVLTDHEFETQKARILNR